ncbi:WD40 repeat domain-containing protein [Actinomadura verrucosospora]|nr:WD40 repeat domain-containing protein [Actinomadura verrucosospora]
MSAPQDGREPPAADEPGADDPASAPGGADLRAQAADHARVYQAGRDQHFHYGTGTRGRRRATADAGECPYPGLAAFGAGQARWFFGRDRFIAELLGRLDRRLRTGGIQMVVAPSGAGKSSLLHAGLLPRLSASALPGSERRPQLVLTPTADPLRALAARIVALNGADAGETAARLLAEPRSCAAMLRQALGEREDPEGGPGDGAVVVVDQFEELFTLCPDEAHQRAFVNALADLAAAPEDGAADPVALVVVGLRADFYAACVDHPELRRALQDGQLLVGAMDAGELREAIEYPAQDVGLELEPGLVELLLRDLGATADGASGADPGGADGPGYEAGRLPLLAHALRASWRQRHGAVLTVEGYEATGGIQRAIATTADDVMAGLDDAGRDAARTVFLRLVRIGDGADDTRRRLPRAALVDAAADPSAAAAVVDAFTAARLLTRDRDTVEITHDALLRSWPRLRRWIDGDRAGRLVRQDLEEAADGWERRDRDTALLYRGSRLDAAREWAAKAAPGDVGPVARAFLAASVRSRRRAARLRTGITAVLAVLVLVAVTTAVVALKQRDAADEQQRVAIARQLVAKADTALDTDPRTALRLDLAAHRLHPDAETYASLQQAITTTPYAGQLTGVSTDVTSVAYSPDGRYLAAGFASGAVMLWDMRDPSRPRRVGAPFIGFDSSVMLAFAAGGRRLVTASPTGASAIWDLTDPARPRQVGAPRKGDQSSSGSAWLSADGTVLATSSKKNPRLQLWDLTDPARIRPLGPALDAHPEQVLAVAFSAGGTMMATSGGRRGSEVKLWDVRRREAPRPLGRLTPEPDDVVGSLSFSADGKELAVGGGLRGTALWNVGDPARARPARGLVQVASFASGATFSPRGTTLAAIGNRDTGLQLWDTAEPDFPRRTERLSVGENDRVVAFSPDGRMVASGSVQGRVTLWNLGRAGHPRAMGPLFHGHTGYYKETYSLAVSRDATMLATGGRDDTVALWEISDPARPRRLGTLTGHTGEGVNAVGFAPDGTVLATGDANGAVILWDLADRGRPRRLGPVLTGPTDIVRSLVFTRDGATLLVGGDRATLVWDVRDHARPRLVAKVLGGEGVLGIWQVRGGRVLALVRGSGTAPAPAAVPQPTIPASGETGAHQNGPAGGPVSGPGDPKGARLWDITDPRRPRREGRALVGHDDEVGTAAMSPAGDLLVTGDRGGAAILWDVKDPAKARRLGDPLAPYGSTSQFTMAFAPKADIMATGGIDGDVYLWDLGNRILPRRMGTALAGNVDAVFHVAFSADGKILATADGDGGVVLWDLRPVYDLRRHLDATTCLVTGGGLDREQWARYLPTRRYENTCAGE